MPTRPPGPSRPPTTTTTTTTATAAVLLAAALSACSGTGRAAPAATAGPSPLDAKALAALADDRPATALPPSTATAEQAAEALVEQPDPGPVGPYTREQVRDALDLATRAVAATRADGIHLCGPPEASPLSALATPSLKAWLADPANAEARIEAKTTISASGTTGDCGGLAWVGPGVVPGPQTWDVAPGAGGAGLEVTWAGSIGYALTDRQDRPEPWGLRGRVTYRLVPDSDGEWRVDGWADAASGRVAQGWPRDVPLPAGYLADPPVPAADPKALRAVRAAARAWAAAPASTVTVEQSVDGKAGPGAITATAAAAPARGDAAGDAGGTRMLWLDDGRRVRTAPTADNSVSRPRWTERDATDPTDFGVSAPVSPFAVAALLADADAAAPAECPDSLPAAECFTAVLASADPGVPLSADTSLAHRAGIPWLLLDVGLDDAGRPAHVRLAQQAMAFGEPYARLVSTARFTAYPDSPPPPPDVPATADVAAADGTRQ